MASHRFALTLATALGAHTAIVFALSVIRGPEARTPPAPAALEEISIESSPPPLVEHPRATTTDKTAARTLAAPDAKRARREPDPGTETRRAVAALPAPAVNAASSSSPPTPSIDLGIGTYWKNVAVGAVPPGTDDGTPATDPAPSLDEGMRAELHERDRALGLGSEGPLVSAAHEAASPSIAPDTGSAIFDVECDAFGQNITARVVSASADLGEWNDVAGELRRLLASKKVRVPKGARGLRTRLEILAERVLPGGEHATPHAGAVPDDVVGSEPQCVGVGARRKCVAGMPVGFTGQLADLTNIGATRSRVVRVHVLGETPL